MHILICLSGVLLSFVFLETYVQIIQLDEGMPACIAYLTDSKLVLVLGNLRVRKSWPNFK